MSVEISLKVFNPSPYSDLSSEFASDKFFTFCNDYYDLIMTDVQITPELLNLVRNKLGISGEVTTSTENDSLVNYLIFDCMCTESHPQVSQLILENHGIEVKPVHYKNGWEYHNFVCVSNKDQSKILKQITEKYQYEILKIEKDNFGLIKSFGLNISDFFDSLTELQISLLSEAYNNGYYRIPRKIKLIDIAEKYGLSRHAIEKRLRRGENSIMELVVPFIDYHSTNKFSKDVKYGYI